MPTDHDIHTARYLGKFLASRGSTFGFTINWTAGYLTGRTWTSTLKNSTITPVVVGDTMTVTFSEADTASNGGRWTLYETTGSLVDQPTLTAVFSFNDQGGAAAPDLGPFTVELGGGVTIEVEALGGTFLPAGGDEGQVLAKASDDDYDVEWVDQTGAGGGGGTVEEVVAGAGISVDATDPAAPIVTAEVTQAELDAEATTRGNADSALDGRLDTLEAISIATDAELASAVAAEATARDSAIATAVAAEATLARNGDNITSGTVADARIASTIARDSEVTAAIAALSTVYQPLDSDLTAIAALTTTSFGRSLLEAANASALRTLAGLVLGTDVYSKAAVDAGFQPLDADLTAIAAIATTAFGRSLLAAADTAAARTLTGAGPAPLFVRKTADESVTSSTTLQADDHLTKAVEASKTYFVRARIYYTASVAGDIKILWTAPAGATFEWDSVASPTFGVGGDTSALQSGSGLKRALGDTVSYGGVVTGAAINVEGFLTVAGTAGNFALTWAQNTSDGTATTVQAGSRILLQEVA